MTSPAGRYVVVFNGEAYNHLEIRRELAGDPGAPAFRGRSDTETLLAAIEWWGLPGAIERLNGMFALALWDRAERRLHLCRDRMGEKPLYYAFLDGTLLFGSELKALRAHPAFRGTVDRDALALYLRHGYIPAPYTIFHEVRKLPPASWLSVRQGETPGTPIAYWSAREAAERGTREPLAIGLPAGVERVEALLRDAVRLRMEADVPLGAFLSGGVDSSTVVALMQAEAGRPVRTFTVGFTESRFDEAPAARAVAGHLGTEHTEIYVTPAEAMAVIPTLAERYDEPFADSSQIPTVLVSALARRHITVSLSGDGGDELFGGYTRYAQALGLRRALALLPAGVGTVAARALTALPPAAWGKLLRPLRPLLPAAARERTGERVHRLAGLLSLDGAEALYLDLLSHWTDPARLVPGAAEPPTVHTDPARWASMPRLADRMMYLDQVGYLPDDILVKVDRASMSESLEARVPFLDHRLVELAWRLPLDLKLGEGAGKRVLRALAARHLPSRLLDRPKKGFSVPIGEWLRGPLRDWAEPLLSPARLAADDLLDPEPIRRAWSEHLSGARDWQYRLWDVLVLQAWRERWP